MTNSNYRDNPINEAAWASFVKWAATQPKIVARFEQETGECLGLYSPPKSGLGAMIDKATGYGARPATKDAMRKFIYWVTEHQWGLEYAPTKIFEEIRAAKKSSPAP